MNRAAAGYRGDMTDSQRNLLILVAVAVAGVLFSGAFGTGAAFASLLLNLTFTVLMIAAIVMLYQRNAATIAMLPSTPRFVLQAATLVLGITVATGLLQVGGLLPAPFGWANDNALTFWALVFACGFAIWWAWQQRTSRW